MGHPGRPRRRNKIQPVMLQQEIPQPARQRVTLKEEPTAQLHDEADLVTFRADTLHRFINNQDYIENVVSKHIHTSKIIPPRSFPLSDREFKSDDEALKAVQTMRPDELYFGNLKMMRTKNMLLEAEIAKLKQEDPEEAFKEPHYQTQKDIIHMLSTAQASLSHKESLDSLEEKLRVALEKYESNYGRAFKCIHQFEKREVPIETISRGEFTVDHAPDDYDLKNIGSAGDDESSTNALELVDGGENLLGVNFENSIDNFELKHAYKDQEQEFQKPLNAKALSESMPSNPDLKPEGPSISSLDQNFNNNKQIETEKEDGIDELFDENLAQSEGLDVVDPMNELIDFSQSENELIIPENSFQLEFLDDIKDNMD